VNSFVYTAIDATGKQVSGQVPAESRIAAMDDLTRRGLSPITINESSSMPAGSISLSLKGNSSKVPQKSVENFTRELANLLAGGLSLSRALSLLRREASHPGAKAAWTQIHDDVVGGESLADALAKFPRAFSGVYIAMVRAGETGGFLHVVLQQIADFRQRESDLKGKVKAALIYPIALAVVASAVLVFLLTYFIPRFSAIFDQFGSNLPWLTQVVVLISGALLRYGIFIALAGVVVAVMLRKYLQTEAGKLKMERAMLATPALGLVLARFALVRFTRMLGTLVGSGVPLVASLRVARQAIGNQILSDTVGHAIEEVQRGVPLSKALSGNTRLFPPSVIEMISVAEESGRLDQELVRLSTTYEGELDRNLRMLVAIAEPLLLIIMAALIGTVVVSMLLPVFTLQDMIN
jgi:type II secretory pathway component PulF